MIMRKLYFLLSLLWCVCGCVGKRAQVNEVEDYPRIFPDYREVTIPVNIAPLNFKMEGADQIEVEFRKGEDLLYTCKGREKIDIPLKKWKHMLETCKGEDLFVKVFVYDQDQWLGFKPFPVHVVTDSIDPYLAYRLIEPGYELGKRLALFQRELSTFEEKAFVPAALVENSCVNCHAFCNYSPDCFMFHIRWDKAGTVIVEPGKVQKINTKTDRVIAPGAYRMWHPSGKYIAFSNNKTHQAFHALQEKKIEVYDLASDLMIYDVVHNRVLTDSRFTESKVWETFPAWSPDGKYLYFCQALSQNMPMGYQKLKYRLYRVAFDEQTGILADSIEKITIPDEELKSVSFPSVSPDGRYVLYTVARSGTFPVHHKDADLEMLDLNTGLPVDIEVLNSRFCESYHAWSSSGRWIVFNSRRMDNLYTYTYFAYFDRNGKAGKPFILPQRDPDYYVTGLKSFNIPEFIKGPVRVSPYELEKVIHGKAENAL